MMMILLLSLTNTLQGAVGKKCMIRLISGKNAGQTGVVSKIMDKDVLLEAVGGARAGELHKLSAVVWISNKLS